MNENSIQSIISDITDVSSEILNKDLSTVRGFSERQLRGLAKQALIIQKGIANGDIDEDLKDFFFDGLEAMALNFVRTLKGIISVTVERLWNAIVDILWEVVSEAVDTAT